MLGESHKTLSSVQQCTRTCKLWLWCKPWQAASPVMQFCHLSFCLDDCCTTNQPYNCNDCQRNCNDIATASAAEWELTVNIWITRSGQELGSWCLLNSWDIALKSLQPLSLIATMRVIISNETDCMTGAAAMQICFIVCSACCCKKPYLTGLPSKHSIPSLRAVLCPSATDCKLLMLVKAYIDISHISQQLTCI